MLKRKRFNGSISSLMANFVTDQYNESGNINEVIKVSQKSIAKKETVTFKVPKKEDMKVLLCGIAKMENNYIREWVEHYKDLGFDNICLFDNNDIDGEKFEDVIGDYIESGFVILKNARGYKAFQIEAYNSCYSEYSNQYDFIAFFDIDEFLTLNDIYDNNVKNFICDKIFNSYNCIRISWENYDDNDLLKVDDNNYNCKERFTRPIKGDNESKIIIKTKLKGCFRKDNPHVFSSSQVKPCNAKGKTCLNINTNRVLDDILKNAKLKHYRWKTIEEFVLNKMKRLWPTNYKGGGKGFINLNLFFETNKKTFEKEQYAKQLLNNQTIKEQKIYIETNNDNLSIAIVGNSPCALGKKQGEEIDKHDIVLRFNNFQINGYEEDLGKKTTMIAVVSVIRGYKKTDMFLNLPKECRIFRDDHNPPDTVSIEKVFNNRVKEEDVIRIDDFIKLVKNRMPNYKQNHYPSTGLVMMQYLADKYPNATIDAYAITFFAEKKIHIYDNATGLYHDRNAEINYFNTYLKDRINLKIEQTEKKKTIAIVGNSPILMDSEYGEEIDNHDIVVRINNFKIETFEKNVGTKTTDIFFNIKTLKNDKIKDLNKKHLFYFYTNESKRDIDNDLTKKYHKTSKDVTLLDKIKYFIKLRMKLNSKEGKHASTGLIAIQYFVDNYPNSEIDVYGITFFSDAKNNNETHYDGTKYVLKHDNYSEIEYFNKFLSNKVNLKL